MISNEMTTPLSTIIFFLNFIGSYLRSVDDQSDILSKKETKQQRAIKYVALIHSQLQVMQGFCNDLLDLRKLKDGMFHLVNEVFDPTQIFDLVCSIFSP